MLQRLGSGNHRMDGMLSNKDLESIDKVIYQAPEDELIARSAVTMKTDDGPGAATVTYKKLTKRGAAKIMAVDTEDVPLVSADITEASQRVVSIKDGFEVSAQDKRAAAQAGTDIDTTMAETSRRAISESEDTLFYKGDTKVAIKGILNATGITIYTVDTNGQSSPSTLWSAKTSDQIIEDIRIAKFEKVDVNSGCKADRLELPPVQFGRLSKKIGAGEGTILAYLKEQGWFPAGIVSNPALTGQGLNGANCGLCFDSRRDKVQLCVPMDIYRYPPVVGKNNAEQINLEERCAGAIVRFPLAICRFDGI